MQHLRPHPPAPAPGSVSDTLIPHATLLTASLLPFRLPQVHNNFGGGFVSDEDRVALSSIKFASAESAGAKCISSDDGQTSAWLEASMEQLCVPLPPWSLRAGARETIWFNPADVNAASKRAGGRAGCSCGAPYASRWNLQRQLIKC